MRRRFCVKHWNRYHWGTPGRLIEIQCPVCEAQRAAKRIVRNLKRKVTP